jgi:tyrosine-protein kinase Etk/Wzc
MTDQPTGADFDAVALVVRGWRRVAIAAALGAAIAIAYVLLAPAWYSARLTVMPSSSSTQKTAVSNLAASLPAAFDQTSSDVYRIQAVLSSNSVADEVIEKLDLKNRYEANHLEQTRQLLWNHCGTSADRRSGLVTLTCEDTDPKVAMQMAAQFGEIGNRVFRRISASSAREERTFLEGQVTKARAAVDEASRKLREFQELHKIVDLPEQSKAVISAMASIKGELISKQLELSYLSSFSGRTESSVVQLQQQISIMQSKLNQLEAREYIALPGAGSGSAAGSASSDSNFFPGAMMVPELRFQLEQLMREQKIQETVFFLLTQRFETAKVDEARDTSTFQILDSPTLPTYQTRPKRRKTAALGLVGGIALGILSVLLPAWWRRRKVVAA